MLNVHTERRRAPPVPFSLFADDRMQRIYARLHISRRAKHVLLKRCLLTIAITWVPVALLAHHGHFTGGGLVATNFFADFAAYAQFLVAMPLFVFSEPIIDAST